MTKDEWSRISPLTLAYLGDTVYEMYVRSHLVAQYPGHTTHELHRRATRLVRASAQAYTVKRIMDELTEEEASVFRRGAICTTPPCPSMQTSQTTARPRALKRCWGIYIYSKRTSA